MISVKVIRRESGESLVEWQDQDHNRHRNIVPTETLVSTPEGYTHKNPQAGIPYGVDWESVVLQPLTASALATTLRNNGLFTEEDLAVNLNTAKGLLLGLLSVNVNKLVQHARKIAEEQNG